MKKTMWLLACFGIFYTYGCRKPADDPAVFRNSFSCKINGVDWKPEGGSNATGGANLSNIKVQKAPFFEQVLINAFKEVRDPNDLNKTIVFEGFNLTAFLELNSNRKLKKGNDYYNFLNKCGDYTPDSTDQDRIAVTEMDTTNKRIKGVFQFNAKSAICNETIKVTEGKFDVKY